MLLSDKFADTGLFAARKLTIISFQKGMLDPETVVTPGIFVHRVVAVGPAPALAAA